jgi:hypothetical protein
MAMEPRAPMNGLGGDLPHELVRPILQMLSMRPLATLACVSAKMRDAAVCVMLARLAASDFGKRWNLRTERVKASTAEYEQLVIPGGKRNSSVHADALLVGALEASPFTGRGADGEWPNAEMVPAPAVMEAPRGIWRRFIFGCRQKACAPAEHPTGAAFCARSIHVCNIWIRAVRLNSWRMYDTCEEYGVTTPTEHFMRVVSPAYGRASFKRTLQENALLSCLMDVSSFMHDRDKQAVVDFEQCETSDASAAAFALGAAVLRHDNWACSWSVWAVYEGVIPTFVAIALGLADLDCLVPVRLCPSDSVDFPLPDEYGYQPLRQWLHENRSWISPGVVRLFQQAAGETADVDIDDSASDAGAASWPDESDGATACY